MNTELEQKKLQEDLSRIQLEQFSHLQTENRSNELEIDENLPQSSQIRDEQLLQSQIVRPSSIVKKKFSTNSNEIENYENLTKTPRKIRVERQKLLSDDDDDDGDRREEEIRHSASSMRTRNSDYDSGFGTHNTTKLSRDR